MSLRLVLVLIGLLVCASCVAFATVAETAGEVSASDDVVVLTSDNFREIVDNHEWTIVKFFAPWCGHCKAMAEDYKKLAASLKGQVVVAEIDCTVQKELAAEFGVKSYPTIKLFKHGQLHHNYKGARTQQALTEYLHNKMNPAAPVDSGDVVVLTAANFQQVLDANEMVLVKFYAPWCGHCKNMREAYMEAATELKGTVVLAELDGTEDSEIAKSYGVSSYPTIKLFVRGEVVDTYDGSRTKQDFIQYIADQRAPPVPNHVVTLTAENFMETVRSNSVVFVKFHAPWCGYCKAMARDFKKTAAELKDKAVLADVEGTTEESLAQEFNVTSYPTLKLFVNGSLVGDYKGDRTQKRMTDFVQHYLHDSGDVVQLSETTFQSVINENDAVLVKFFAPWCTHCKQMVDEYKATARSLKGVAVVAEVDYTLYPQLSKDQEVKSLPTLKLFSRGQFLANFKGNRVRTQMVNFVKESLGLEVSTETPVSDVVSLTDENFHAEVTKADVALVKFFAPWCGHCKNMAEDYQLTATALKGTKALIAELDGSVHRSMLTEFGIKSYPTLILFEQGKEVTRYRGARTQSAMTAFVRRYITPPTTQVQTEAELDTYLARAADIPVVLSTSGEEWYVQTARDVSETLDEAVFLVVSETLFAKAGGAAGDKILLVYKGETYSTASEENITQQLLTRMVPLVGQMTTEKLPVYRKAGLPLLVAFVDEKNVSADVHQKLETVATSNRGKLLAVAADAERYASFMKHLGLTGDLPLFAIHDMTKEAADVPFTASAVPSIEELQQFVQAYLSGTLARKRRSEPVPSHQYEPVIKVVGDSWSHIIDGSRDVLLEQYAPWCKHCVSLEPVLLELANDLQHVDTLIIAKMDATKNDAPVAELQASSYPTLQFFAAGASDKPIVFQGNRTKNELKEFLLKHATHKFNTDSTATAAAAADTAQQEDHHDEL